MAERYDPEKSSEKLLNKFFSSSDEGMPPTPGQPEQPSKESTDSPEELEVDYQQVERRPGLEPTEDDFDAMKTMGVKVTEEGVDEQETGGGTSKMMERLVEYVEFRLADQIGQAVRQHLVDEG